MQKFKILQKWKQHSNSKPISPKQWVPDWHYKLQVDAAERIVFHRFTTHLPRFSFTLLNPDYMAKRFIEHETCNRCLWKGTEILCLFNRSNFISCIFWGIYLLENKLSCDLVFKNVCHQNVNSSLYVSKCKMK